MTMTSQESFQRMFDLFVEVQSTLNKSNLQLEEASISNHPAAELPPAPSVNVYRNPFVSHAVYSYDDIITTGRGWIAILKPSPSVKIPTGTRRKIKELYDLRLKFHEEPS